MCYTLLTRSLAVIERRTSSVPSHRAPSTRTEEAITISTTPGLVALNKRVTVSLVGTVCTTALTLSPGALSSGDQVMRMSLSDGTPEGGGEFYSMVFGDTEFSVPKRYTSLNPKGVGAQGMVW